MSRVADQLTSLWPALAFLLVGVPLAALLDHLGFFEAVATIMTARGRESSVLALWLLAAVTTVLLNLDTTIVLLTPLYFRIARRVRVDPIGLVVIPLLLASLASSVLPVSNLTTLIVSERFHLGIGTVLAHLGLPSLAAISVGWLFYRRRYATRLPSVPPTRPDARALTAGGSIVAFLLLGFVVGPAFGVTPWMTATAADLALIVLTRTVPWRAVPVMTAAAVAVVAVLLALVVPATALRGLLASDEPASVAGITLVGAGVANVVNNLPTVLLMPGRVHGMTWGGWAWLLGANVGSVLLPIGALANLLWRRLMRAEGVDVGVARYARLTFPIALPALIAAAIALGVERAVLG